jgi:hypothetical protein
MKLHTAPQHAVEFGNGVSSLGEYRINNSPKAFAILSSGLYANKLRAILRELGCNAWDSHVAAGRNLTPFDLHLPTQLEPWFAIRDYGTGLTHDQVVNIYTTYFESTKTGSNDFIGALGLGSKSPFSYTDNFTVTAIRNGRKGIYTAFINDRGVPAIALLMEEDTEEPSGVEVKFAVSNTADYNKFRQEAQTVFTYFAVKPVVNLEGFQFSENAYLQRDIVPGVHQYSGGRYSRAIMGNIAYPIEVPNAEQNLGDLHHLLHCSLELNFAIGELDFQASREGLSYIPMTIDSIRAKLELLNNSLIGILAQEADAIDNMWLRALFLAKKHDNGLWRSAVIKYCADTKFDLFNPLSNSWDRTKAFEFTVEELATKYNISITGFQKHKNDLAAKNIIVDHRFENDPTAPNGHRTVNYWKFRVSDDLYFALNDTKIGASERGKYHWRVNKDKISTHHSAVYIASAADRTKPMLFDDLMAAMYNPPRQCRVSSWDVKPRDNKQARDVSVLKLEDKDNSYWARRNNEKVWRDAGKADSFDASKTYYYLPLSGYTLVTAYEAVDDAKALCNAILGCGLKTGVNDIYGVRKADLDWVKTQKNWVNLEDHMISVLKNFSAKTVAGIALTKYNQKHNTMHVSSNLISKITKPDSAFINAIKTFENVESVEFNTTYMEYLVKRYSINGSKNPLFLASQMAERVANDFAKYPMLRLIGSFRNNEQVIADYINMVDSNG